jgi:hypothetical protein
MNLQKYELENNDDDLFNSAQAWGSGKGIQP